MENKYTPLRILVIDDDKYVRQLLRQLLGQLGFKHIYDAENGEDGFRQVVRTRPHLILCDIHMKPVNGFEFLKVVRHSELSPQPNVPVIFLTGDRMETTVMQARDEQIAGYVTKPVSVAALQRNIDNAIQGSLR